MSGMVRILFFAWLRERLGRGEQVFALPAGPVSVRTIEEALADAEPVLREAFASGVVRAAVNGHVTTRDAPVSDGDELAFLPPFTGG